MKNDIDIVTQVRDFVETESRKPSSKYGFEPFVHHFIPMVQYAKELAEKLGADVEIVEISAWLHDIGAIVYGREDHHLTGAKIAEEKLREFDYSEDKIMIVKKCIENHRGSVDAKRESLEEQIIAEADALSNFDNISGIFKAAFMYEDLDQSEAQKAVYRKLKNKWDKLHFTQSRELVRAKYEAAVTLLKEKNDD